MSVYLVDFENVKNKGLAGAARLSAKDVLYIFYSKYASKFNDDVRSDIEKSGAAVDFITIHKTAKNYLDFQLSTFLGFLAERYSDQNDFHIISSDKGYDAVVDFWKDNPVIGKKIMLHRDDSIASSFVKKMNSLSREASEIDRSTALKAAQKTAEKKPSKKTIFAGKGLLHCKISEAGFKLSKAEKDSLDAVFVSSKKSSEYLSGLRRVFGQKNGGRIYAATSQVFSKKGDH